MRTVCVIPVPVALCALSRSSRGISTVTLRAVSITPIYHISYQHLIWCKEMQGTICTCLFRPKSLLPLAKSRVERSQPTVPWRVAPEARAQQGKWSACCGAQSDCHGTACEAEAAPSNCEEILEWNCAVALKPKASSCAVAAWT